MGASGQNRGCLGFLIPVFGGSEDKKPPGPVDEFPYKLRDDFLTQAERSFYGVLALAVGTKFVICPKVRLGDVFFVSRPNENRAAINRIGQKHVDFLLCNPDTMKPALGIELDDASHGRPDRKSRDEFVDRVFEAGDVPLLRVPAKGSYDPQGLRNSIRRYVDLGGERERHPRRPNPDTAKSETPAKEAASETPACPKCGEPMVIRTSSRGETRGKRFFGCPNYPKCRGTLPLD